VAAELPVSVCKVTTPEGTRHYVTVLSPETMFSQGIVPEAIVGVLAERWQPTDPITPDVFARNKGFVEFLHEVIARYGPAQAGFQAEARRLGDGWVYVIDQRTPTPQGAVPPEDIVGGFEVKGGMVVPGSYVRSPKHRILSERGFMRLSADLQHCLLQELAARNSLNAAGEGRGEPRPGST
jgi:hypothetical protein